MTKIEVYKDRKGEWRWRLQHTNGNILADSGEGYTRKQSAKRAAVRSQAAMKDAKVVVV